MDSLMKNLSRIPSFKCLSVSFSRLKGNPSNLVYAVFFDMIFLVLYGFFVMGLMADLVVRELFNLGIQFSRTEDQSLTLSQIILQESARPMLMRSALILIVMIAVIYLLYSSLQSVSWWLCRRIAIKEKEALPFFAYARGFFHVNVYWFIIMISYNLISFLRDFLSQSEEPGPSIILAILFFVMAYFIIISYSMLPNEKGFRNIKRSFSVGLLKIAEIFPAFLISGCILALIEILLSLSSRASNILFIVIGALVLMPVISWARAYFILMVGEINKIYMREKR